MPVPHPSIVATSTHHLRIIIGEAMRMQGPRCNLNHVDVSQVQIFDNVFKCSAFNGDISNWNLASATSTAAMFMGSAFNGNISNWNMSQVVNMEQMFENTLFSGDVSRWNVSKATNMNAMFKNSGITTGLSHWDVSNVVDFTSMFANSKFNGDLSKWNVSLGRYFRSMFESSQFNGDVSGWDMRQAMNMSKMFKKSGFRNDISQWDVPQNTNLREVFGLNKGYLEKQPMTAFILNVHLQNNIGLNDVSWRLAVRKYNALKDMLELDSATMAKDIVRIHAQRGKKVDALSLNGLGLDNI